MRYTTRCPICGDDTLVVETLQEEHGEWIENFACHNDCDLEEVTADDIDFVTLEPMETGRQYTGEEDL